MKFNESTYQGSTKEVTYTLEEAEYNTDYLIIVFSGFSPITAANQYRYNYVRTLRRVDAHKLFILDKDGPRGSYYLGKEMSFDFEQSVSELIHDTIDRLKVDKEKVITAGTSKGGSAAIYYALKYKLGQAIAGAPQTKIADYITRYAEETAAHVIGETSKEEKIKQLNALIVDELANNNETLLTILGSVHDKQYPDHIVPFVEGMEKRNHPYTLLLDENIKSHGDIAKHYPDFIVNKLLDQINGFTVEPVSYQFSDDAFMITTDTVPPPGYSAKIRFYDGDNVLREMDYDNGWHTFPLNLSKPTIITVSYCLVKNCSAVFRDDVGEHFISDTNVICNPTIEQKDAAIHFALNLDTEQNVKFAFYTYYNRKIIDKIMYQEKQTMTYTPQEPGRYFIKYFIMLPSGEKVTGKSDEIHIGEIGVLAHEEKYGSSK